MTTLPSANPSESSSSRHHNYSRKQKSLGLLCTNFLSLYDRDGVVVIGLDDAASKLGVERRRIYDIVNVLESVGVLTRKAKNQYTWKGFGAIPATLEELKKEGLRENNNGADKSSFFLAKVSEDYDDDEDDTDSSPNCGSQNDSSILSGIAKSTTLARLDNRKEKSLGLLTQNFVKLFLYSDIELISLDDAAKLLLGDGHNLSIMRTKVRRLYDIANVLSSIKLIEKTHAPDTRKPAFRWLGISGKSNHALGIGFAANDSRKRSFGADVTNICFKRSKVDSIGDKSKILKMQSQIKVENAADKSTSQQDSQHSSRSYQFGPFAPVTVINSNTSEKKATQVHDWENLASTYRPLYHNQALRDLFAHYMEAWQSWYTEVAGKKTVQKIS